MKYIPLSFLALAALPLFAADPPAEINVQKMPSQTKMINRVVVPVPREVFAALDKIQRPVWEDLLRKNASSLRPEGEMAQVALTLGTIIGEGFIAVEAENTEEVKNLGQSILAFSESLGVKKAIVARANSIIEFADKKDWRRLRLELDGALSDVRDAMTELGSEPLAHLVSVGGWIRGTEALAEAVDKSFSRESADLLYQPGLLDYFEKRFSTMKARLRDDTAVVRVRKGLAEIRPILMETKEGKLSQKNVKEIGKITSDLVKAIQTSPR